jgi:hypothetical protein
MHGTEDMVVGEGAVVVWYLQLQVQGGIVRARTIQQFEACQENDW